MLHKIALREGAAQDSTKRVYYRWIGASSGYQFVERVGEGLAARQGAVLRSTAPVT